MVSVQIPWRTNFNFCKDKRNRSTGPSRYRRSNQLYVEWITDENKQGWLSEYISDGMAFLRVLQRHWERGWFITVDSPTKRMHPRNVQRKHAWPKPQRLFKTEPFLWSNTRRSALAKNWEMLAVLDSLNELWSKSRINRTPSSKTVGKNAKQSWKRTCGISGSRHLRSHAYLFCVLPHGFSRNRETDRSLPGGVRDEQKDLGFTGREREKNLTLVILTCSHGNLPLLFLLSTSPFPLWTD